MNRSRPSILILAILSLGWLFVVTLNYYIVHKPFGIENLVAILTALGDVLIVVALFMLAGAVGRRLMRSLTFASLLEAIVFQIALGLAIISFATLTLGLLGLLNGILFWIVVLVALLLLRHDLIALARTVRAIAFPTPSSFERVLAVFTVFSVGLAFFSALTPPIAWDSQAYHLVIPQFAIEHGRITMPPDIPYFSFPSLVEMLFLAAMLLKGDIATQLIHTGYFLLLLGGLFAFAQRFLTNRTAWLAVAILVAVPSFFQIAMWAYVDVALACYAFLAVYALMVARDENGATWFVLAGVGAGLAMGVKYTAVIVPIALGLVLLWRRDFNLKHWAMILGSAALVAVPWYARNLVFMGNPVYPFVFGGPYWDSFRAYWFGRLGTGLANDPLRLLSAPWEATILGIEGKVGYQATIGPLLLTLLPLLVVYLGSTRLHATRKIAGELLVFSIALYAFWLFGIFGSDSLMQTRLLFPAFPVFAILAACAFEAIGELDLAQFSLQRFASMFITLVLVLTGIAYWLDFIANNPLPYITGFESRSGFLARNLGAYDSVAQWMNTNLGEQSKTLLVWEPRSYYIHRAVQPDTIVDHSAHLFWKYGNPDALAMSLRDAGYTHILVNRAGLENLLETNHHPISDGELIMWQDFAARYLKPIYPKPLDIVDAHQRIVVDANSEPYVLYEILRGPLP